jgi:branched-chain amino acid transport system ATP-binding protein
VRRGEIVAMIGANGAGKTTTLKTIARSSRSRPRARITYDGLDLGALAAEDVVEARHLARPRGRAIFPNLTVRENLELGAYTEQGRRRDGRVEFETS